MKAIKGAIFLFTLHIFCENHNPHPNYSSSETFGRKNFYGRMHHHGDSPCVETSNVIWTVFGVIIGTIIGVVIMRLAEKQKNIQKN